MLVISTFDPRSISFPLSRPSLSLSTGSELLFLQGYVGAWTLNDAASQKGTC